MTGIAILIPTLRRPDSLARTLRSVFVQDLFLRGGDPRPEVEIVVVDNSPEASARVTVDALRPASPIVVLYVHAPTPGVATARNAGLAATTAGCIAFIDDDEEAPPGWLSALETAHRAFGADVTFGPVQGVAAGARPRSRAYLERFFSRLGPARSGLIETVYGCGNSIMTRAVALPGETPFDTAADHVGGEDDRLFAALKARGARFAWAADALVYEHAPPHRARIGYALRRAFAFGQAPSQACRRAGDGLGVVRWMAIGTGQAAVYGVAAAALWAARRPARYDLAGKAAQGLGKLVWFRAPRFYGAAEARRTARQGASAATARGRASLTASAVNTTQSNSL